jgi:hypothetical protein
MFCQAYGGDRWVVRVHLHGPTARLYVLPGRCKAIVVHTEVETLFGSGDCVRTELMDTVTGEAEQWAKECLTSGVLDEEKKELRVFRQIEVASGGYRYRYLRRNVRVERLWYSEAGLQMIPRRGSENLGKQR